MNQKWIFCTKCWIDLFSCYLLCRYDTLPTWAPTRQGDHNQQRP